MERQKDIPYKKLKLFLYENGIKQENVAIFIGKSASSFNKSLNGTGTDFKVSEAMKICRELNINPNDYFFIDVVPKFEQERW